MPSTVTFTGTLGAAVAVTSLVFENVLRVDLRIADGVADIYYRGSDNSEVKISSVQISDSATLTDTVASGVHTIAIANA